MIRKLKSGIYEYEFNGDIRDAAYIEGHDFAYDKESGNIVSISCLTDFIRNLDRFEFELYEEDEDYLEDDRDYLEEDSQDFNNNC